MKARFIGFVSALALAAGVALFAAGPGHAATPAVQITKVYYNSPGTDTRSNKSLNAEYVRLTNRRTSAIKLKGWTLRDKANHVYTFATYTLGAGKSVYIHTGKGTNTTSHRYWGQGDYVWNNTGDTAYLRTPARTLVDSCSWGSKGSYTTC
ncbi:lamin tail domain-containing protein [Actinopolymorpha sp. B17G11]|uniref:lamin tail domain-containing protein n=1 Tax=Actinopolymorpha sp. B17G11 TaxID=3160861 RepID=UPI0032E3CCB9